MLLEDAAPSLGTSANAQFPQQYAARQVYTAPSSYTLMPPVSNPMLFQQQQQQMIAAAGNASMLPVYGAFQHETVDKHSTPQAVAASLLPPQAAPMSPLDSAAPRTVEQQSPATPAAPQCARPKKRAAVSQSDATAAVSPTSTASSDEDLLVKVEPLSPDEQKKLRRRNQIACSVQRHREKKKTLVSTLKHELAALTSQLELLRSQRKDLHANERLLELEELAVTQRRKRRQAEEVNARMKKALFQQSAFLLGMRAMMDGLPAPHELEFHDWVHSYTVLSASDLTSRRREYTGAFSASKMELAAKLVLRETEGQMARLDRSRRYAASVRLLHDGTQSFVDATSVNVPQELRIQCDDAGNGQVIKKYSFVFLFEEGDLGFDAFRDAAWESSKQAGVFWPGAGYSSQAQDIVEVDGDGGGDGTTDARVYFTHLSADMSLVDELENDDNSDERVTVESRMLCREQKERDQSIFLWDYVDRDELYPLPTGAAALRARAITRKACGAMVVRREPGGFVSIRSASVKIFATSLQAQAEQTEGDAEAAATLSRRLGLQVTEVERGQNKCARFVYNTMLATFAAMPTSTCSSSSDGSSSEREEGGGVM